MPIPFAKAVVLWSGGRAELLGGRRGLAVVAVVAGDDLATAIGTQVLEAKSERHGEVLHEFDQSRQRFILRRHEVYRLELSIMAGAPGHEAVVPVRRGRDGA